MPQVFPRRANAISRLSLPAILGLVALTLGTGFWFVRSPLATGEGASPDQPVLFSHEIHAGSLAIDCRYCHTSVETSAFAGMPPTQTCITCHAEILTQSPLLDPVRESWAQNAPLRWRRVNDIADFAYFHHGIHLEKGVGCATCHGRVDQMDTARQVQPLTMGWCLDCHRSPERYLQPPETVLQMDWQPPEDRRALGRELVDQLGIKVRTSCSTCHR